MSEKQEMPYEMTGIAIYRKKIEEEHKYVIRFVFRGSVEGHLDYKSVEIPLDKAKKIYEHIKDKDIYNRLGQKIKMVVKNPFLHKVLQEKPDVS